MPKNNPIPNEVTCLARKRTELAQERTALAYFRTAASLALFGVAFLGFSGQSRFFRWVGIFSLIAGALFLLIALHRGMKHQKEINEFKEFFHLRNHKK
jgi:uncharacterized membrane protein YidH (DUF202 family)